MPAPDTTDTAPRSLSVPCRLPPSLPPSLPPRSVRHTTKAMQRIVLASLAPLYVSAALLLLYVPAAVAWNVISRKRVARKAKR